MKPEFIYFRDYQGIWTPLTRLYLSQSLHLLVSKHPISSLEEVISIYCPQCFVSYEEEKAIANHSRCITCFECPKCLGILVKQSQNPLDLTVKCHTCGFSCDLSKRKSLAIEEMKSSKQKLIAHFQVLTKEKNQFLQDREETLFRWNFNDLLKKIENNRLNNDTQNLFQEFDNNNIYFQKDISSHPKGIKLRTKRTIRCKKALEEGKMNILLQPKPFALKGDSSLKSEKGKWYDKDSLAIHDIVFFKILKVPFLPELLEYHWSYLIIQLINPKDQPVTLEFPSQTESSDNLNEEFIVINDLGSIVIEARKKSFRLSSNFNNDEASKLSFEIKEKEDELLRDETSDESNILDEKKLISELLDHCNQELRSNGENCAWHHTSYANNAILAIPLTLPEPQSLQTSDLLDLDLHFLQRSLSHSYPIECKFRFSL